MGICTRRYFMLTICALQLLSIIERQVFDFLGFLWIPILVNFFQIVCVIFGFFGAFQYRPKYIITYSLWSLLWLGWNSFLICLYLDIGILNHKESKVLKLDPDSGSWWENGPGCKGTLNTTAPVPTWENVTNCLVDYRHVEVFQAGLQCVLAFLGAITGFCLSKIFLEEDDSSSRKLPQKNPKRTSLYSIEFSPHVLGRFEDGDSADCDHEQLPQPVSPKPMTPRRVKRRSVMTRGSSGRHSTNSRRHSGARSSTRSSRRAVQNPVTRLLEQQQKVQAYDSPASQSPTEPLPSYYSNAPHYSWQSNGHTNPTYQQSSIQSLNEPDDLDDLYNNRPPSARSSYSNFHGTRVMNHAAPAHYHSHATPQVPQKRNNSNRHSMRSMMFLSNGPPAYSSQGHTAVDSETTM